MNRREETLRVILLEDSDIDADLIQTHLEVSNLNFSIQRTETRADFEAAIAEPADVVLADFALPNFDGMTALEIVLERAPRTPFIFVSGVVGEEFATRALQRGATDYVTKRNLRRLPVAIRRALEQVRERERRRGVEAALAETENRFRLMADQAPAYIWATDARGRLTFVNRRFEDELGVAAAHILDEGPDRLFDPGDFEASLSSFRLAFQRRESWRGEMRARTPQGEVRWLRCEATPRFDSAGAFVGYVGSNVDITEARLAADELEARVAERTETLKRTEEALRQSQKMEAIGQLTGGIAHDFNNLLAGIIGALSVVKRRIAARRFDDLDRFIDGAVASGNRAASLTQRLLAFSRRQSLDVRVTDLNAAIRRLEELLRNSLGENIQLEIDLGDGLCPALTDANQFESAVLNLIINARDAMPDGGAVSIRTEPVSLAADVALSIGVAPGDYARVVVADTGAGMDEEVLAKAFDPFFTTKPIGQGTGLGLSMIYGFAKQTGGHVTIHSVPGQGTSVSMLLPRSNQKEIEDEVRPAPLERKARDGETILVVEDEPAVRMLVVDVVREMGYGVIEAADSASAEPLLRGNERIDLLITDVGLPGINGRELADRARLARPELPVLFITGYAEGAQTRSGFLGPGMDMLAKPFDIDDVAAKVDSMLGGGGAGKA